MIKEYKEMNEKSRDAEKNFKDSVRKKLSY